MNTAVVAPMKPRTLNLLVGLIRDYMGLAPDQVVIYNQKWRIPSDSRIYVTVGLVAQKPYASVRENVEFTDDKGSGLKEVVTLNSQETISLNFYSKSQDALLRKDEVIMALGSTAAQQLCEANSIKLGQLPISMVDVSALEGVARLNRYVATVNALVARSQERIIQYYDNFQATGLLINP